MRLRTGGAPVALPAAAVLLAAGVLLAGCTGHSGRPGSRPAPSCSPAAGAGFSWPPGIPANLPLPPGARLGEVRQLASGFTLVTFTAPGTVRTSLLEITAALQAAGYTVGRGIVGTSRSRLPFTRDGRPGVLELTAVDACTTRWQVQA
ncbi:hypothetical protein [Jatrophihabitans sp.]|uniref:hypothetical protein n=1 Tax=Jatrophihabitans sp. TaxID=1932789 RepID=UPI002D1C3015|nr:hypothetical protein [Jatrophihabitans sp.]